MTNAQKLEYIETPGNILTFKPKDSQNSKQVISLGEISCKDNLFYVQSRYNSSDRFNSIQELIDGIDWEWMQEKCIDVIRSF